MGTGFWKRQSIGLALTQIKGHHPDDYRVRAHFGEGDLDGRLGRRVPSTSVARSIARLVGFLSFSAREHGAAAVCALAALAD